MATKFLRKIILEELQKVLKEVDYSDIPGSAPGQTNTPIPQAGPSGMTPKRMSYGSPEISKPKSIPDVKKLQQDLNATGKYKLAVDGILGPETMAAVRKEVGWKGTPQDMLANISKVRGMLQGAISAFASSKIPTESGMEYAKPKLAGDLAAANQARGPADIVLDTTTPLDPGSSKGIATPPGPSADDEYKQNRLKGQQDLERKMRQSPTKIKTQQEAIAREINKLLRSL